MNNRLLSIYDDYQAIVIGISDYEYWPKIPNAIKDAKAVAQNLKELGFEIKLLLDLSSRELKTGFSEQINDEQIKAIGIGGYVMKTMAKSELAKSVRKVLDG